MENTGNKFWDGLVPSYDTRETDPTYMAAVNAVVRSLNPQAGEVILDAGCGTGITLCQYFKPSLNITAVDFSETSLELLRSKLSSDRIRYVQGDIIALPFESGLFDRSLCANTIQHIRPKTSREKVIKELTRVTKPGGIVVVSAHQWSVGKQRAGWKKEGKPGGNNQPDYIYRFEPDEYLDLLGAYLSAVKVFGAGFQFPRGLRFLERTMQGLAFATNRGHMLVGIGISPK